MTVEEYIEANGFPDVKKLGKIKGTTYYIEADISDEDTGIPFAIGEHNDRFFICTSDEVLQIISAFGG